MDAGRDLDALVAEKVMELVVKPITYIDHKGANPEIGTVSPRYKMPDGRWGVSATRIPDFSTDMAAAWEVVEKLGGWFHLAHFTSPVRWRASFDKEESESFTEADTAPLAICLAALKAVEAPAEVSR